MPVKKKKKIKDLPNYKYNTKEYQWKQKIMWFGVAALASIVIFMWFLATNAAFFDINKNLKKSQEAQILNESTLKVKEILTSINMESGI